jgi:hypothetical protein
VEILSGSTSLAEFGRKNIYSFVGASERKGFQDSDGYQGKNQISGINYLCSNLFLSDFGGKVVGA